MEQHCQHLATNHYHSTASTNGCLHHSSLHLSIIMAFGPQEFDRLNGCFASPYGDSCFIICFNDPLVFPMLFVCLKQFLIIFKNNLELTGCRVQVIQLPVISLLCTRGLFNLSTTIVQYHVNGTKSSFIHMWWLLPIT